MTFEVMRGLLANSLETAALGAGGFHDVGKGPGSTEGDFIDWLTIKDQPKSVTADVRRIRNHPLVPGAIRLYGYIYDVKTGRLVEVPEATEAGTRVPSAL
jgi:carbonic anhydrase